jgi:hypothetical protein
VLFAPHGAEREARGGGFLSGAAISLSYPQAGRLALFRKIFKTFLKPF